MPAVLTVTVSRLGVASGVCCADAESQLAVPQVAGFDPFSAVATAKLTDGPEVFSVMVCACGTAWPISKLKYSDCGAAVTCDVAPTVRVAVICRVYGSPSEGVTVIVPLYVPTPSVGSTEALTPIPSAPVCVPVTPEFSPRLSQFWSEVADTLKLSAPPVLPTVTDCVLGTDPPNGALKVSCVLESVRNGFVEMTKTTLTTCAAPPPAGLIIICAACRPVGRELGETLTFRTAGVFAVAVLLSGDTPSQLEEPALVVMLKGTEPALAVTVICCGAGSVPPVV